MRLGLAMVVKDEAANIEACLAPIADLFEQVSVVDTGSADATPDILRDRFGIEPVSLPLDPGTCGSIGPGRNLALSRLTTPWAMLLDADERVERGALDALLAGGMDGAVGGLFCRWDTHGLGEPFEDYKLALFRRGYRTHGLVHGSVQPDFRLRGGRADWLEELAVKHFPDPVATRRKHERRKRQLAFGIGQDPGWHRYHWFLGYTLFREGLFGAAEPYLRACAADGGRGFPVESLNSRMVLAELLARRGDRRGTRDQIRAGIDACRDRASDFEVRVNFRQRPWFESALEACERDDLEAILAYRFAY